MNHDRRTSSRLLRDIKVQSLSISRVLSSILFCGLLFIDTPRAAGNGVYFEGNYSYHANVGYLYPICGTFQVSIQGASWIAQFQSMSAATNAAENDASIIASFDGTNVFVAHIFNPLWLKRTSGDAPVVRVETMIYPGHYPPPMIECTAYNLWLAFISSTVWNTTTGKTAPINTSDLSLFYNPEFHCNYEWVTDVQTGLKQVLIRSDGRVLRRNMRNKGTLEFHTYPRPFQDGFISGAGDWIRTTNFAGVSVPTEFAFSYFMPHYGAQSAQDVRIVYLFQCDVTNAHVGEEQMIPAGFQAGRYSLVRDHRYAKSGYGTITYGVTNQWTAADVDKDIAKRMHALEKVSLEDDSLYTLGFNVAAPQKYMNVARVRMMVAIFAVLPPCVFACAWWQHKTKLRNKLKHKI